MCRSLPAGSGGAATAGRGNRSAARAMVTLRLVASSRPATAPTTATVAAIPLLTRNRRRAGPLGGPGSSGLGR